MVRIAFLAATTFTALADDTASLLQANTGKKRLQAASAAQWVEDFARAPAEVATRVASMHPVEQQSLLQQFASLDAPSLVKEIKPHQVALALALRRSPLASFAKASPSEWVSALQQHAGDMDSAVSHKGAGDAESALANKEPLRSAGDGGSAFESSIEAKGAPYSITGGRCRDGLEFEDVTFDAACSSLCDSEDTCEAYETEEEEGTWLCKRFSAAESTLNYTQCEAACTADGSCTGFEFEAPEECELYTVALTTEGDPPVSGDDGCHLKQDGGSFVNSGERGRTGGEFADLTQSEACTALCAQSNGCDSQEAEVENGEKLCKRFTASLQVHMATTLKGCAQKCTQLSSCHALEWDDGECELHGDAVNATLSTAEEVGDNHACYFKST